MISVLRLADVYPTGRRSMPLWKNYYLAQSIPDALEELSEEARLIAGGTDLLLEIQQGLQPPVETLIDVSFIPELTDLDIRGNELFIGAAVTLNQIVASPLVQQHAKALCEACNLIGGPQVRNTATLGGNVAHALPAADGTIALMALDARAEAVNLEGSRIRDLEELFIGPRRSILADNNEILVGFYLPLMRSGQASAFQRVMRPQGVALPVLNIAVWIQSMGDRIEDIRLAIGPSGPKPIRARKAENTIRGEKITQSLLDRAYLDILDDVHLRSSPYRASADYRQHLAKILMQEVIETVWDRAITVY
jgi:carbon-monoxide dehydrogenase medium subunit